MNKVLGKIVRFTAFSASTLVGTGVDTLVLWLCSTYWLNHSHLGTYIISPTISFECAVVANFLVAYFLVWRDRRTQAKTVWQFLGQFFVYNGTCVGGFLIKMFFLQVIALWLGWDAIWCNLLALVFSGCFNFVMNEWVVFRKKTAKTKDSKKVTSLDDESHEAKK